MTLTETAFYLLGIAWAARWTLRGLSLAVAYACRFQPLLARRRDRLTDVLGGLVFVAVAGMLGVLLALLERP